MLAATGEGARDYMITEEDLKTEPSLLKCTVKKSVHVAEKVVLWVSYVIVGITAGTIAVAVALYGSALVWNAIAKPLTAIVTGIVSFLFGVPWYVYAGGLAVAAIPVYSFLWCVGRDLTEEDWKSDAANNFAITLFTLSALALVTFAAFAAFVLSTLSAFAAFVLSTLSAFAAFAALVLGGSTSRWYYIGRFPGAVWHHYRNRKVVR
jgi:hypothetical protein